ncbi:mono/diheme cytochrome c family protein [Acidipila rosea]|uniref:Mono/diheme cytochrome c family protein n=1 Tax=Acidipila rosea TaxID=768535 RepID=A0A4R1L1J4_9BACT|nr:mono/diheme cytochrome c family protein [Acidipila rosea]
MLTNKPMRPVACGLSDLNVRGSSSKAAWLGAALLLFTGCGPSLPPSKPLSQLTPAEAQGHQIFVSKCVRCHSATGVNGLHGPGLFGLYRQKYLPSGAPANDERVTATILHGRTMMPAFGNELDEQQLQDLLAYLHTL